MYINNQFIFSKSQKLYWDILVQASKNSLSLSFNFLIEHFTLHCIQCCSVSVRDRTTHCTNMSYLSESKDIIKIYIYILNYTKLFGSRFLYFQCTVLTSNSWFLISGLYWKKFQPLVISFLCNVNQQNLPYMIRIIILYIRKMHVVADEVYTINSY